MQNVFQSAIRMLKVPWLVDGEKWMAYGSENFQVEHCLCDAFNESN